MAALHEAEPEEAQRAERLRLGCLWLDPNLVCRVSCAQDVCMYSWLLMERELLPGKYQFRL